jgi:hypothetical protein
VPFLFFADLRPAINPSAAAAEEEEEEEEE